MRNHTGKPGRKPGRKPGTATEFPAQFAGISVTVPGLPNGIRTKVPNGIRTALPSGRTA